jgi:hypothetical protein
MPHRDICTFSQALEEGIGMERKSVAGSRGRVISNWDPSIKRVVKNFFVDFSQAGTLGVHATFGIDKRNRCTGVALAGQHWRRK